MKAKINVKGPKLVIGGFTFSGGEGVGAAKVTGKSIDLTPYAGRHVRVWLDQDGRFSLDPHTDHFWQLAEFDVPDRAYKEVTGKDIETGEDATRMEPMPLDLSAMEIRAWTLPG